MLLTKATFCQRVENRANGNTVFKQARFASARCGGVGEGGMLTLIEIAHVFDAAELHGALFASAYFML